MSFLTLEAYKCGLLAAWCKRCRESTCSEQGQVDSQVLGSEQSSQPPPCTPVQQGPKPLFSSCLLAPPTGWPLTPWGRGVATERALEACDQRPLQLPPSMREGNLRGGARELRSTRSAHGSVLRGFIPSFPVCSCGPACGPRELKTWPLPQGTFHLPASPGSCIRVLSSPDLIPGVEYMGGHT